MMLILSQNTKQSILLYLSLSKIEIHCHAITLVLKSRFFVYLKKSNLTETILAFMSTEAEGIELFPSLNSYHITHIIL